MTELLYKIKNRRGLAAEWLISDTVLAAGEIGIESDTGKIKVGDGEAAWSALPYLTDHDHDAAYAAIDHAHDEAYSGIAHDHDEAYSAIGHGHEGIGDALSIKGVIVDDTDLADGRILAYAAAGDGSLVYVDPPEGGAALDLFRSPVPAISYHPDLSYPAVEFSAGGAPKYAGGVLAGNGCIYFLPATASPPAGSTDNIGKYNPDTGVFSTITLNSPDYGLICRGGVLAPDGRIWGVPYDTGIGAHFLVIDPDTDTYEKITVTGWTPSGGFWGGVLAPDGLIYLVPAASEEIIKIDPIAETVAVHSTGLPTAADKWAGGALMLDGRIICAPGTSTDILIIDPAGTHSLVSQIVDTVSTGVKWTSPIVRPHDGSVFMMPGTAAEVLVYHPNYGEADPDLTKRTIQSFDLPPANYDPWYEIPDAGYWGAALGIDGRIYAFPSLAYHTGPGVGGLSGYILSVLVINPNKPYNAWADVELYYRHTYLPPIDGGTQSASGPLYVGAVTLPNGDIIAVPGSAAGVLAVHPGDQVYPLERVLSAYVNKL